MSSSAVFTTTPHGSDNNMSCLTEDNGGRSQKTASLSRYESQKRRDWSTFGEYLKNHKPPLLLSRCSGAHILEFLRYLDQFGKTKVHRNCCPFYGHQHPPVPCPCPLRQAWGSLDALVGRLRAAFEENGGKSEANPFGTRAVRLYLREVRDSQAKARGIAYEKKKRKKTERDCVFRSSEFDEEDEEEEEDGVMKKANVDAVVAGSAGVGVGVVDRCSMISPFSVLMN